jgi:hypothetical protein
MKCTLSAWPQYIQIEIGRKVMIKGKEDWKMNYGD